MGSPARSEGIIEPRENDYMGDDKRVREADISVALAKRHRSEFFITQCKNGPTLTAQELLIFDALVIYKAWTKPRINIYEIKVTRKDFLGDSKMFRYLPYCHELYVAAPLGIVERAELPMEIGLVTYNPKTKSLNTVKKPIYREIAVDPQMLLYVIMNRLESDRTPFTTERAELWEMWLDNKINSRQLGRQVSSKMLRRIEELEREVSRGKDTVSVDRYRALTDVVIDCGLNPFDLVKLERDLRQRVSPRLIRSISLCRDQLNSFLQEAQFGGEEGRT